MKKLFLFFLILNFSCNNEKFKKEYYPNGNLKSKIKLDDNGIPNGNFEEYYENGILKAKGNDSKTPDSAFIYFENGKIKEKGMFYDGLRQNWWVIFDQNGKIITRIEYFKIKNKTFKNQYISYSQAGDINYSKSSFFKFNIPDTLKIGKNLIDSNEFYTDKRGYKDFHFLSIIIDNRYSENETKKDTFQFRISANQKSNPWFGIYAYKKGRMKITGEIEEKFIDYKLISNDSADAQVIKISRYFSKEIFVKHN
ncbi:toxin-antitoxin system YwqK family antitoxin [Flavobacterium aquidurense]|uniref:MORN repeat variant n=1 Tax=Flavobacterium aquidurense TaxID=362413 RepID=A0A0Q0XU75_9FLAO|nr:hypothetical protein [Flavobacterium aquidurense]KQB39779.1 hypothetical protein RC62_1473 [Flavobacterium aquidurense]